MGILSQTSAPVYEALERFRKKRVVPFDVPGHKRGRGNPELRELLLDRCCAGCGCRTVAVLGFGR